MDSILWKDKKTTDTLSENSNENDPCKQKQKKLFFVLCINNFVCTSHVFLTSRVTIKEAWQLAFNMWDFKPAQKPTELQEQTIFFFYYFAWKQLRTWQKK